MDISREDIRKPAYAGSWYEGDPEKLRAMVTSYMENAKLADGLGKVMGIISPHAGHMYSGPVAGPAFKQIQGQSFDTVVVIAPNHGGDHRLDFSSVYTRGAYETPLGIIPVDIETAKAVVDFSEDDSVKDSDIGHLPGVATKMEHSLEIILPFLQVAIGEFALVPIVMGDRDQGFSSCPALAGALAKALKGKNALLVASSDLSHFFDIETLKEMDGFVCDRVETYDPEGLLNDLASGKSAACGGMPIAAVMMACREIGATEVKVLSMANSGDISGDYSRPVGYMGAVITAPAETGTTGRDKKVGVDLGLTEEEKNTLRDVVKETLESVVNGGPVPKYMDFSGKLGEHWGAFVTLNKREQLRGCIGRIQSDRPLIETVAQMTKAAALKDSRFRPVTPTELPDIEFEISVLTPFREIKDVEEIEVGVHGIMISQEWTQGLLLPQVATEYNWDRTTFLEHTCRKAGLPLDAWKDSRTKIEIFSAELIQ